jgi:Tol biopolymer transport system component
VSLAALSALAATPAHATITYEKNAGSIRPTIWVSEDSGAGARQLAGPGSGGEQPLISPDGSAVIFQSLPAHGSSALSLVSTAGGAISTLVSPEVDMYSTAWSPDSKTIVTAIGTTPEHEQLVLIDLATRATRVIATGNFQGASFSPDSTQLAYSRAPSDKVFPTASDIYTVPVAGGTPVRLTRNHRSSLPVWGPTQIAFARSFKAKGREDAPKSNIWLMNPNGSGAHQLTRQRAPFLLSGPVPLDWSASGSRLLAQFGGQDTSYGEGVNPSTGAVHKLSRKKSIALELVAAGISRDGSTVLAATGGYDPGGGNNNVVTVPFAGGPLRLIARHAFAPSWND